MKLQLRPNQEHFVEAIRAATGKHPYVLGQAPTGYGKSFIIAYLTAAALGAGHTVHVHAHKQIILDQIGDDFKALGIPFGCVYGGQPIDPSQPVQLCTPFSIKNKLDYFEKPTFVLEDECHRVAAKSWSYVRDWYNADEIYGIGVTATPARLDGKPLKDRYDYMVAGPSMSELIGDGTLVKPWVYAPPVDADWSALKRGSHDYTETSLEAVLNNKKITGQAVEHYQRLADGTSAVVFCVSIKHARDVAEGFEAAGIPAANLDSTMGRFERKSIVDQFRKGAIKVLTSCDLITEGFNLPAVETCIMLRKTKSLTLYLQAIGRALRSAPGKDRAIILDHVGNAFEHGMPADDRDWSLEGGHVKTEAASPIKQCPDCYLWAPAPAKVCPCGHEYATGKGKPRTYEVDADGHLELIDDEPKVSKLILQRQAIAECKTLDDFIEVGKRLGYRPGWANIQYSMRRNRGRFFGGKKKANG